MGPAERTGGTGPAFPGARRAQGFLRPQQELPKDVGWPAVSAPEPLPTPSAPSLQPHLAVGSNDYYISVYSVEKRVR